MPDLPAYSSPLAACPKCAHGHVGTYWHGGEYYPPKNPRGEEWYCCRRAVNHPEHLCRLCRNCGFAWAEALADAEPTLCAIPDRSFGWRKPRRSGRG